MLNLYSAILKIVIRVKLVNTFSFKMPEVSKCVGETGRYWC